MRVFNKINRKLYASINIKKKLIMLTKYQVKKIRDGCKLKYFFLCQEEHFKLFVQTIHQNFFFFCKNSTNINPSKQNYFIL
jgi:hypothetical protein